MPPKVIITVNMGDVTVPGDTPPPEGIVLRLLQGDTIMFDHAITATTPEPATLSWEFDNVPPGDYTEFVQAYTSGGAVMIGTPQTRTIHVAADVTYQIPVGFA